MGYYVKMVLTQHAEKAYGTCSVISESTLGKIQDGARDTISGNIGSLNRFHLTMDINLSKFL